MSTDTAAGTGRQPHPLTAEVLRLVTRVRAAAVEDEETATVEALDAELARSRRGAARVVVVGEKKRGKSSLVNALIGRPGLLPVEADIASCVHVVVGHGDEVGARVWDAVSPQGRPVATEEIVSYAALDPATREPYREDVTQVAVDVPSPLLAHGLELVDTPGVGGLVAGHAALTLATLDLADALVFVLDSQSEITQPELTFLERASERIASVAFAVTKTDAHPEWQAVLARNLELVATHAPRYAAASWFPVSARVREAADRAEAQGRPDVAARRLAASGLPALEAHLVRIAAGAEALRLANLVHQADLGSRRLASIGVRRGLSLTLSPEFAELVTKEKAALTALQGQNATWRQSLSERTGRLEQKLRTELARGVEDVRRNAGEQIAAGEAKIFDEITADLPVRVQALWAELDGLMRRELPAVARAVSGEDLQSAGIDLLEVVPSIPDRLKVLFEATRGQAGAGVAEHGLMAIGLGSMAFHGSASLLAGVLGGAAGPIGFGLAAVLVGFVARRRQLKERAARSREDARRYLTDVCTRLTTEVPPALGQAVAGARDIMVRHVSETLVAEKERLTASLAEHEKNLATEKSALQRRKAAADKRLKERTEMRQNATALAERLRVDGKETS